MLVHQKYFVVENDAGKMTNSFVAVANTSGDESGEIRRGHERVLRARFNDARFFWQFDQRSSLAERVAELKDVTFQASIGSYWDKTQSNLRAAKDLAESLELDGGTAAAATRAVELAKCDLTTEMVGEFPELQGKIGGLYAAGPERVRRSGGRDLRPLPPRRRFRADPALGGRPGLLPWPTSCPRWAACSASA